MCHPIPSGPSNDFFFFFVHVAEAEYAFGITESLEAFKAKLNGAWGKLWKVSLPIVGEWNEMVFKAPPAHSMIW